MVVNEFEVWIPRVGVLNDNEIPDYVDSDKFTMKMYHGGCIRNNNYVGGIRNNNYVGGKVDFYDNVDKDRMSLVEVDNMVKGLNQDYEGHKIDYEDDYVYVAECYSKKTYMKTYSNIIMPVNSMDLWARSEEPPMLPPQYSRQPGRPKTKRIKDATEKANSGPKLGRVQKSLKCGNCGVLGHNTKTCHRHLPPKEKKTVNKKRKLNSAECSSSQTQTKKRKAQKPPLTKNELRQKAKEMADNQKKKMSALRASRAPGTKSVPTRSRPQQATSTPTSMKGPTPTRSSQRIRQNSKAVGK